MLNKVTCDGQIKDSLFPSNEISLGYFSKKEPYIKLISEYSDLLNDTDTCERAILNFINNRNADFLVASILKKYFYFGHHGAFLFPEFQLSNNFQVDYLIVGRNSDGYHFLFIEFESPYGEITLADGYEGKAMRKGLNQVKNWEKWLEENYSSFIGTIEKYLNPKKILPKEFYKFDKSRMNYAVVVGRRTDFNETTYRVRRELESKKVRLLHYDNLMDNARDWIAGKLI